MSVAWLPARVESQTISSPSCRTFGRASLAELLTPPVASCAGPKSTLKNTFCAGWPSRVLEN
jgi:hypothetical protein